MDAALTTAAEVHYQETEKQRIFAEAVFSGKYRYLAYGGAIRGGKSYGLMAIIFMLCRVFPGSRWAIVRKDQPTIERNLYPVFEKLRPAWCSAINGRTHTATCDNGSQIIFFPETWKSDKGYDRWRGLEVNGFWLEEANELQQTSWNWALQRAGAWVVPKTPRQPPPLILLTFNPSGNWVKTLFYSPWKNGALKAPFFYLQATPKDNPYLTQAYRDSLELLPERDYKVYVMGDWDELGGAALEELNEKIHIVNRIKEIPDHWLRFGGFDWGYRHPFSFGLYAASPECIFKIETITGLGMADAVMIAYILEVSESVAFPATDLQYVVAGKDAFHDVQARANVGATTAERFAQAGIPMIEADTSRISGLKNFRELTSWKKAGPKGTPGEPRFKLFDTPSNRACFAQLQNMVLDPDRPEDVLKVNAVDGAGGDDFYDETRYALQSRAEVKDPAVTDVASDVHPGFDYAKRERKPRKQNLPAPGEDDDLRPGIYRVPRQAGYSPWRLPRQDGVDLSESLDDDGEL